jgi:hypothetical protein
MSALAPFADSTWTSPEVREVPGTEVAHLFDHLVRDREQRRRHGEAERLRSRKVDDELELSRLLDAAPFTLT